MITATLKNWYWSSLFTECLVGEIHGDTKGRFEDGLEVRTSTVASILEEDGQMIAVTRNSRYLLEDPRSAA